MERCKKKPIAFVKIYFSTLYRIIFFFLHQLLKICSPQNSKKRIIVKINGSIFEKVEIGSR